MPAVWFLLLACVRNRSRALLPGVAIGSALYELEQMHSRLHFDPFDLVAIALGAMFSSALARVLAANGSRA